MMRGAGEEATMTLTVGGVTVGPFTGKDLKEATKAIRKGKAPMKETDADKAVADKVGDTAGAEILSLIERYERVEAERKELSGDLKEIMGEAKGRGYDTKVLRRIIALRKRDADDVAEEEAVLDLYKAALGMA